MDVDARQGSGLSLITLLLRLLHTSLHRTSCEVSVQARSRRVFHFTIQGFKAAFSPPTTTSVLFYTERKAKSYLLTIVIREKKRNRQD